MFIVARCLEGRACLWGDVIYSNIERYVMRYFIPFLRHYDLPYTFNKNNKLLTVGERGGFCDFRSADNPMTWEGMGYHHVFLNEAGIILDDEYLYYNTILPMLIDFEDSELIALGTPKVQQGKGMLFKTLFDKGVAGEPNYLSRTYSSYDNPFITTKSIDFLKSQIPAYSRDQEIYGKFVTGGGSVIDIGWFKEYISPPDFVKIVQSWDTSSKAKQINDPSACTTWGITSENDYYLLDVFVERLEYPKLKSAVKNHAAKHKPDLILIEDKSSGISLIQDLESDITFAFDIIPIEPEGDKITRMATASLPIENGQVYIPDVASWREEYIKELQVFPNTKVHDDQVDSTSQFLNHEKQPREIFIG